MYVDELGELSETERRIQGNLPPPFLKDLHMSSVWGPPVGTLIYLFLWKMDTTSDFSLLLLAYQAIHLMFIFGFPQRFL